MFLSKSYRFLAVLFACVFFVHDCIAAECINGVLFDSRADAQANCPEGKYDVCTIVNSHKYVCTSSCIGDDSKCIFTDLDGSQKCKNILGSFTTVTQTINGLSDTIQTSGTYKECICGAENKNEGLYISGDDVSCVSCTDDNNLAVLRKDQTNSLTANLCVSCSGDDFSGYGEYTDSNGGRVCQPCNSSDGYYNIINTDTPNKCGLCYADLDDSRVVNINYGWFAATATEPAKCETCGVVDGIQTYSVDKGDYFLCESCTERGKGVSFANNGLMDCSYCGTETAPSYKDPNTGNNVCGVCPEGSVVSVIKGSSPNNYYECVSCNSRYGAPYGYDHDTQSCIKCNDNNKPLLAKTRGSAPYTTLDFDYTICDACPSNKVFNGTECVNNCSVNQYKENGVCKSCPNGLYSDGTGNINSCQAQIQNCAVNQQNVQKQGVFGENTYTYYECEDCPSGQVSSGGTNGTCNICPNGKGVINNDQISNRQCVSCSSNNMALSTQSENGVVISTICISCQSGQIYASDGTCMDTSDCIASEGKNLYPNATEPTMCKICSVGQYYSGNECKTCASNNSAGSNNPALAWTDDYQCLACQSYQMVSSALTVNTTATAIERRRVSCNDDNAVYLCENYVDQCMLSRNSNNDCLHKSYNVCVDCPFGSLGSEFACFTCKSTSSKKQILLYSTGNGTYRTVTEEDRNNYNDIDKSKFECIKAGDVAALDENANALNKEIETLYKNASVEDKACARLLKSSSVYAGDIENDSVIIPRSCKYCPEGTKGPECKCIGEEYGILAGACVRCPNGSEFDEETGLRRCSPCKDSNGFYMGYDAEQGKCVYCGDDEGVLLSTGACVKGFKYNTVSSDYELISAAGDPSVTQNMFVNENGYWDFCKRGYCCLGTKMPYKCNLTTYTKNEAEMCEKDADNDTYAPGFCVGKCSSGWQNNTSGRDETDNSSVGVCSVRAEVAEMCLISTHVNDTNCFTFKKWLQKSTLQNVRYISSVE